MVGFALSATAMLAQNAPASAKVTFFRSSGGVRGNTIFSCDHDRYKITVYSGDSKLIHIRRGKFVTLDLAPGKYVFRTSRSKPVEVTLVSGDQVFLRPRQTCGGAFRALEALDLVLCAEALEQAKSLDPIDAKDIEVDIKSVENQRYFAGTCAKPEGEKTPTAEVPVPPKSITRSSR
jgi:hypothetical protein